MITWRVVVVCGHRWKMVGALISASNVTNSFFSQRLIERVSLGLSFSIAGLRMPEPRGGYFGYKHNALKKVYIVITWYPCAKFIEKLISFSQECICYWQKTWKISEIGCKSHIFGSKLCCKQLFLRILIDPNDGDQTKCSVCVIRRRLSGFFFVPEYFVQCGTL